jgi:hypothetical protein
MASSMQHVKKGGVFLGVEKGMKKKPLHTRVQKTNFPFSSSIMLEAS